MSFIKIIVIVLMMGSVFFLVGGEVEASIWNLLFAILLALVHIAEKLDKK